jgi:hypothetical protein
VGGDGYIFATWLVFYFGKFSQPSKEKEKRKKEKKKKENEGAKRYKGFVFGREKMGPIRHITREKKC